MTVETIRTDAPDTPVYSIVVPFRDRLGAMFRNCLRSIQLQTLPQIELIIVDYGSTQESHEELLEILPPCTLYRHKTTEPWNLAAARNIGLRRAKAPLSVAIDADLILEPRVLERAHLNHLAHESTYQTSQVVLLNEGAIDPKTIELPHDYPKLLTAKSTYLSEGWGGFTSAPTWWWRKAQGFNEEIKIWGWEDVDMWKRAARAGMNRKRLSDDIIWETAIYHQPHINIHLEAQRKEDKPTLATIKHNERLTKQTRGYIRNDEHWGNMP